ncbi:hypothetical protein ACKVMT_13445 [Halobacteriales archaeon Cl-PHB]
MADLLTHVLVAWSLLTVASWWLDWLDARWIPVGVGGVIIPDLVKLDLLLDADAVEAALGIPFSWGYLGSLGGVVLTAGAVTMAFDRCWWRRVYSLLVVGGSSALILDGLRAYADGRASFWLFPVLPSYRPPTPSLYVSSDPIVPALALALALVVLGVDRWVVAEPTW